MTIVRSLITVVLFVAFVALWVWAWRKERQEDFAAAARLPLEDDMPKIESK
ncbi:MAG TPA: cbb3-type cytochrome c oxidase subunit 3 [Steroidobacteraceae bacterium]